MKDEDSRHGDGQTDISTRTSLKCILQRENPTGPCHGIVPFPKRAFQALRNDGSVVVIVALFSGNAIVAVCVLLREEDDGGAGYERTVFGRGGEDAVFLREEECCPEGDGFGGAVLRSRGQRTHWLDAMSRRTVLVSRIKSKDGIVEISMRTEYE